MNGDRPGNAARPQYCPEASFLTRLGDTIFCDYFDVRVEGRVIELRPVRIEPEDGGVDLVRIREKIKRLGVTGDDVATAVRWARRRK